MDHPDLPTLVLVPGLACDAAVWTPLWPALQGRVQPQVLCWQDETRIVDVATRLLRSVAAPRFLLAGHSLGGRVALEVLRLAPERVHGLALLDTGTHPLPPGEAGERECQQRLALVALAQAQGMRAMGERWAPGMLHPQCLGSPVHEAVLAMVQAQPVARFAAQQQALMARPDAGGVLPLAPAHSLVLCGREDAWSPLAQHEHIAAQMPAAHLVAVPDCGHMSPQEQPEAVGRAMVEWLQALPPL